jgi:hypothetical protein
MKDLEELKRREVELRRALEAMGAQYVLDPVRPGR